MRRHPVISGFLLLILIGFVFYIFFYRVGASGGKSQTFSLKEKIGVVNVEGVIHESREINAQLKEFAEDSSIVAIVLRIDSPGGGVAASQEIFDGIIAAKKKKKVIASLGSVAASGGLLIACAADQIVANPGTITGSISAVMQFANVEELLKKIGVKSSVVKSGQYKDIGSPFREMTADEKKIIKELVDDIFNQFIDVVMQNRNISRDRIMQIADGRIFSGRKAKDLGLVDHLGGINAAARLAFQLAGKEGEYELIYPRRKRENVWDYVFESAANQLERSLTQKKENWGLVNYLYTPKM